MLRCRLMNSRVATSLDEGRAEGTNISVLELGV
jgi:hypothetical protein